MKMYFVTYEQAGVLSIVKRPAAYLGEFITTLESDGKQLLSVVLCPPEL